MLPFLVLLFLLDTSTAFQTSINYNQSICTNSSIFPRNSPYETNLNQLLSTLPTNTSTTKNGFFERRQGPVYGQALCRGDLNPSECHDCVELARNDVKTLCVSSSQAILWKEQCMIRYSNVSFFGLMQIEPDRPMYNINNITGNNSQAWFTFLTNALNKVVLMAASNGSGKNYATNQEIFQPMSAVWYTMAQCTPDLTKEDCTSCLSTAISVVQRTPLSRGGIALTPSCTLRFENYAYYRDLGVSPPTNNATTNNNIGKKKKSVTTVVVAITVPLVVVGLILVALGNHLYRKRARKYQNSEVRNVLDDLTTAESLTFNLGVLEAATNNFSDDQKLGQGGFGSVYKGTLPNGQEIAVKRLSKVSSQGVGEFKNEVVLIANLQHRNLVRLLGFCLAGQEKLLVYEFVPNKSLNYLLFGQETNLSWPMRYDIIRGVARGLLYLHEDSRPRIIHRDLKSGNILLDEDMNPKIADFGLARIFKVEQTEENTNRVVGTYGYMSPEYAMHGQFSVKSDVYSFGILVLEIISSKKITARFHPTGAGDLLTHAWISLTERDFSQFMDPTLKDSYSSEEVMKCIHLGLLCAQDNPNERPTMSSIVLMLNTDSTTVAALPTPPCPRSYYHSDTETSLVSRLSGHTSTTTTTTTSTVSNNSKQLPEKHQETISEMHPR